MGFRLLEVILLLGLYLSGWCSGELINALPGQPSNVPFHQHSGYIVTNQEHGRHLFFYFVEADSANCSSLPLTLWLNGGPGCSSLGFGAFMENGPFQIGNPLLDIEISVLAGEYLWSHGAISDKTLLLEKTVCNDSRYLREYIHSGWSQGCNDVFNRVSDEVGADVGLDDLLLPACLLSSTSSASQQYV